MGNDYENVKQKQAYENQAQCGMDRIVEPLQEPCRDNLRNRVERQMCDAARAGRKAERLAELGMLLDKNPEVARILDLIEEVRG